MVGLSSRSRRRSGPGARQRGAVSLEVVTCLVPLLVLFLCTVQLALLGVGRLVVAHAATRGARSAIVLLEDDPDRMGGAPRGDLNAARGTRGADALGAALARGLPAGMLSASSGGGARLQAIREAVYAPLAAVAPAPAVFLSGGTTTLRDVLGSRSWGGALGRFAVGLLAYARGAAVVTLRSAPGSSEVLHRVEPRADVTVHVTYLQHCSVPVAARLMCHLMRDLVRDARVRAEPIGRELARAEAPGLLLSPLLGRTRFAVVEAEATLPNQGARYYSADDGSEDR